MDTIGIPLETQRSDEVAEHLEGLVVDLVSLSLNGKQAQWHVTGPTSLPVHNQLDVLVTDLRAWVERVARRAVILGFAVDARPGTIGDAKALKKFPAGFVADRDAITEIGNQLSDVVVRARAALKPLGDADPVSQNLVTEILQGLEQHLWILQAQVVRDAGPRWPAVGSRRNGRR
jgi:starvation-inducible DNA-binding protein